MQLCRRPDLAARTSANEIKHSVIAAERFDLPASLLAFQARRHMAVRNRNLPALGTSYAMDTMLRRLKKIVPREIECREIVLRRRPTAACGWPEPPAVSNSGGC